MYNFLENNAYYVVLLINLIIWAGLFGYIASLSSKVKKLAKDMSANGTAS